MSAHCKKKISPDGQIFLKPLVSSQRVVPPIDVFGDPGPREGSEPGLSLWSSLWPESTDFGLQGMTHGVKDL